MFPNEVNSDGSIKTTNIQATNHSLTAYNGTEIKCLGTKTIVCNFNESLFKPIDFYIVHGVSSCVLGLPSCESLNVVSMHCEIKCVNNIE